MRYEIENILDIMENDGEDELSSSLNAFSCDRNTEIQNFLLNSSIDFAKKKMSITYLVSDKESGDLLGYFALTHKVLNIPAEGLSNTVKKRMSRYAPLDESTDTYPVSAFLLAQFGKNYAIEENSRISGTELMDCADMMLKDIQHRVGGGVVYLDCEDKKKLTEFYEKTAGYRKISERESTLDGRKYLQYFKFI